MTKESTTGEQKKLLLIDDDPNLIILVKDYLEFRGYEVVTADHGRKALDILNDVVPDMIICDVMMPEMDGFTLLQNMKQTPAYAHLPVVMLTALSDEPNKLKALTIGVDDYLPKPFSPQELLARVHNLLQHYKVRQQMQHELVLETTRPDTEQKHAGEAGIAGQEDAVGRNRAWVNNLANVLRANLETEHFLVTDLPTQYGMSESTFLRKVKAITGLTPKQLQQEVALQEARRLFEAGKHHAVNAVAVSVGMNNVTRFTRLYQARFGKHPKAYFE